jgi:uncharacterized membrane protein
LVNLLPIKQTLSLFRYCDAIFYVSVFYKAAPGIFTLLFIFRAFQKSRRWTSYIACLTLRYKNILVLLSFAHRSLISSRHRYDWLPIEVLYQDTVKETRSLVPVLKRRDIG